MASFSPQKVFITGATSGIGEACAHRFAALGATVVLAARRVELLHALKKTLEDAHGVRVLTVEVDVRDRDALAARAAEDPDAFADIDVLVNNAGLARGLAPVQDSDPAHWDDMIDTNVKGLLHVTRVILPGMLARKKGHIVNIGSTAGHWVYPGGAVYCATKHAVDAITQGIRLDVHGSGVRVSSVDPGHVETNFARVRFDGDDARAKSIYAGWTPLTPDDVADTVEWVSTRPLHVNVQDVILLPTQQSSARDIYKPPA